MSDKLVSKSKQKHMEVSIVIGVPLYRWMVYFMENRNLKWMMTGGGPDFGSKPFGDGSHDTGWVPHGKPGKSMVHLA